MSDAETPAAKRTRVRKSGLQESLRAERAAPAPAPQAEPADQGAAPSRPAMRAEMRAEDPRSRAARRAQEILDHGDLPDEAPDEFYIDRDTVPPGWDYEWKALSTLNKENSSYETQLRRGGWEPVPASRHPEMMPRNHNSAVVERMGMVLMERPSEITKRVRMRDHQRSIAQVRQKEAQLTEAPQGQFERNHQGQSMVKVSKSYAPVEIPE